MQGVEHGHIMTKGYVWENYQWEGIALWECADCASVVLTNENVNKYVE